MEGWRGGGREGGREGGGERVNKNAKGRAAAEG